MAEHVDIARDLQTTRHSGTMALNHKKDSNSIAIGQFHSGQIFGQMALMGGHLFDESA